MDQDSAPSEGAATGASTIWDARTYLRMLRRSAGLIVAVTLLVAVPLTVWSATRAKQYQASATVYVPSSASVSDIASGAQTRADIARSTRTEVGLMQSRSVREAAAKDEPGPYHVTIDAGDDSDLVQVVARASNAQKAARQANAYAAAYLRVRSELESRSLVDAGKSVQKKIDELQAMDALTTAAIQKLDDDLLGAAPADRAAISQLQAADRARLRTQADSITDQLTEYRAQHDRLEVAGDLGGVTGARVVDAAVAPGHAVAPKPLRDGVLALILGGLLGLTAAFVREQLDDSVRDEADLAAITTQPVLGTVPRVPARRLPSARSPVQRLEADTPEAEAFRTLRTSLDFVGFEDPLRTVLITSAQPGEGKTFCTAELALAYARSGARVLVVNCDLRRPTAHELFGLDGSVGLSSVLIGSVGLDGALTRVNDQPDLWVLPSGPVPPNPAELLGSERMAKVVAELATHFDMVLLDSPPTLPVVDALELGHLVDGVLVVVREGTTSRRALHRALRGMGRVGLRVVGIVMNGGDPHVGYGYGMGRYGYGYRSRSAEPAPAGPVVAAGSEPLAPVTTVDAVDPSPEPPSGGGATRVRTADPR